jgi:cellulase (glycosyl hydrolase family 5)
VRKLHRFALLAALVVVAAPAATASAATQMPVGFFDDVSFRFSPDAQANLAAAASTGVSVIHTTANWASIAPTRPKNAANGADPAYRLGDLDALVDGAGRYGLRVMINVTGAPKWSNGGKTPNYLPKKLSDFSTFVRMLATRYNGHNGHTGVALWSIWNEPNLQQFLMPQYAGKKIVSPARYGNLLKYAYSAIKRANPLAKVAAGETSAQGRDKLAKHASETVSPGMFAKLLSKVKGVKFDAWAHHPYPTSPGAKPLEKVRYPNVTLSTLPKFEKDLRTWFHHTVPVWITEYGHETKPAERKGVTYSQQSAYAKQALGIARKDPNVQMFIWFTFRDSKGNPWQSGLEQTSGAPKPSFAPFSALARVIDGTQSTAKAGVSPKVTMFVPTIGFNVPAGSVLGLTYHVYEGSREIAVGQAGPALAADGSISFYADFTPAKKVTYRVVADVNDVNGVTETRTSTVVGA